MLSNRVVGSDAVAETALLGNKQKTQTDRIPKWIQNSSTAVGPDRLDHNESTRRTSNICTSKNGNLVCIIGTQCCLWSYIISFAVVNGIGFFGCPDSSLYQPTGVTTAALLGVLTVITLICLCASAGLRDFALKLCQCIVSVLVTTLLALVIVDSIYTFTHVAINCEVTIGIIVAIGMSYGILLCICCCFHVVASGNPCGNCE